VQVVFLSCGEADPNLIDPHLREHVSIWPPFYLSMEEFAYATGLLAYKPESSGSVQLSSSGIHASQLSGPMSKVVSAMKEELPRLLIANKLCYEELIYNLYSCILGFFLGSV
jgi:hypothetical protein